MKWEGHEESENVEDRRAIGPKKMAVGGVGALVILLIGAFFGVDPQKLNQLIGNRPAGPNAGNNQEAARPLTAEEQRSRKFAATILKFTEEVWDEQFRKSGERYQ